MVEAKCELTADLWIAGASRVSFKEPRSSLNHRNSAALQNNHQLEKSVKAVLSILVITTGLFFGLDAKWGALNIVILLETSCPV